MFNVLSFLNVVPYSKKSVGYFLFVMGNVTTPVLKLKYVKREGLSMQNEYR
jgi:hypothetical protein